MSVYRNPARDPLGIGARDLYPLADGIGGGMIFDPFNRSGTGYPDNLGMPGLPPYVM